MNRRPTRWLGDPLLWILGVLALALSCSSTRAQQPDGRGEIRLERADGYPGFTPDNPIADEHHVRNEGGSDGAGLCVIASLLEGGMAQGVPGLDVPGVDEESGQLVHGKGSRLWQAAKSRPGGYYPEKLEGLLQETMPGVGWYSHETADPSVLERLSRAGYRPGITMNTGAFYGYQDIAHYVALEHYRAGGHAMIQDNNEPGIHRLMPSEELDRRFLDPRSGVGWLAGFTHLAGRIAGLNTAGVAMLMSGIGLALVGAAIRLRNTLPAWGPGLGLLVVVALAAGGRTARADGGVLDMFPRGTSGPSAAVVPEVIRPQWLGNAWTLTRFKDGRYFFWRSLDGFTCFARPEAWGERLPSELPPPGVDWRTTGVLTGQLRPGMAGHSTTNDPSIAPLLMGPAGQPAHRAHGRNQPCPGPGPCPLSPQPSPTPAPSLPATPAPAGNRGALGLAMVLGGVALIAAGGLVAIRRRVAAVSARP